MSATKTIAITNDERGAHSLHRLARDGHCVDCRCRRCRHKWMEIDDSKHTNGTGNAWMCPRCTATKIDRTRYYKEVPNVPDQTPAALDSANTTDASSRLSASVLFALVLGSWLLSPPAFASDPIPLSAHPSSVVVSGQRSGKIQHGNDTLLKSAGLIIEGDGASLLFVNSSHELLNLLFPPILFNSELDGKVENVFPLFMSSGEMGNEPTGKRTEQPTNNDASEGNKRDDNEQVIFGEFAEKLVHRMLCGIAAGCAVIVLGWVIIALLTAGFGYANKVTIDSHEN